MIKAYLNRILKEDIMHLEMILTIILNNFYISFGVWLIIVPLLGIPISWVRVLVFLSGIFLILVSLGPAILKKLQPKQKSKKKKESSEEELKFSNNPSNPPYFKGEKEEIIDTFSREDSSKTLS